MTDPRLRPATSVELAMELNKLFRALELKSGNPEEKIEGYLIALDGVGVHPLQVAINRIIRGEVPGLNHKFCPNPPELASVVRSETEHLLSLARAAQDRALVDARPPMQIKRLTMEDRIRDARARMVSEGRRLLFTVDNHAQFMSRKREIPTGGVYSAILGEVWGAAGAAQKLTADEQFIRDQMFEPETVAEQSPEPVFADVEF